MHFPRNESRAPISFALLLGAALAGGCAAEMADPEAVGSSGEELFSMGTFTGTGTTGTISGGGTTSAPERRPYVSIKRRGSDEIALAWRDLSDNETRNELYRRTPGNAWTRLATFGADNEEAVDLDYVDTGLEPDTQYCYQVRAINSAGTKYAYPRCAYTRDGRDIPVFRAQLRVKTAPFYTAGTDDDVAVRLNSVPGSILPNGNETWLDYGRNDFEEGADHYYDLSLESIGELSDIIMLSIEKPGDDHWCIEEIALHINENDDFDYRGEVFVKRFGDTPGTCLWLGGGQPTKRTIFHEELRADARWQAGPSRTIPIPWFIQSELESRIESMIGSLITGTPASWGDRYGRAWVEAERTSDSTMHVDLDLEGDGFGPNPEVDVDFDLTVGTTEQDGRDVVTIEASGMTVNVDFDWWLEVLSFVLPCGPVASIATDSGIPDCISALEDYIEEQVLAQWQPVSTSLDAGSACPDDTELAVWVDDYSTVQMECQPVEPPSWPTRVVISGMSFGY